MSGALGGRCGRGGVHAGRGTQPRGREVTRVSDPEDSPSVAASMAGCAAIRRVASGAEIVPGGDHGPEFRRHTAKRPFRHSDTMFADAYGRWSRGAVTGMTLDHEVIGVSGTRCRDRGATRVIRSLRRTGDQFATTLDSFVQGVCITGQLGDW
jgi:hypothetical protein